MTLLKVCDRCTVTTKEKVLTVVDVSDHCEAAQHRLKSVTSSNVLKISTDAGITTGLHRNRAYQTYF